MDENENFVGLYQYSSEKDAITVLKMFLIFKEI
jgi:hypothetical protein